MQAFLGFRDVYGSSKGCEEPKRWWGWPQRWWKPWSRLRERNWGHGGSAQGSFEQDFEEVDWKYEYDIVSQKDNSKFKNKSDTKMQFVDMEISYDKIEDRTEAMIKFGSDTNDWKIIYNKK